MCKIMALFAVYYRGRTDMAKHGRTTARPLKAPLAACCVGLVSFGLMYHSSAVAQAQLPEGFDPSMVAEMIPAEITVPAGQTTTVDVGVPVSASYSGGGWTVASNGTTVTVTAPDQPGASASVAASAAGFNTTVTLVAVGSDETSTVDEFSSQGGGSATAPAEEDSGRHNESSDMERVVPSEGAKAQRSPAKPVATDAATRIDLTGEVQGSSLVVKVSLREAAELAKYAKTDREGISLHYVDVNGNIIEGVKRDVDIPGRTLTLHYPEGQTPDNPFIIEVVRDGAAAEFIAVITATNAEKDRPLRADVPNSHSASADQSATENQAKNLDSSAINGSNVALFVGAIALVGAVVLALLFAIRRTRGRN